MKTNDFYRMKLNRAWTRYLQDHPGDVGRYSHWLRDQLVVSMKKVDSLLRSIEELRKGN